jgi:hypothetical protein
MAEFYHGNYLHLTDRVSIKKWGEHGLPIYEKDELVPWADIFTVYDDGNARFFMISDSHIMGIVEGVEVKYQGLFSYTNVIPFLMDDAKLTNIFNLVEITHGDSATHFAFNMLYRYLYAEYSYNGRYDPNEYVKITDIRNFTEMCYCKYSDAEYIMYFAFYVYRYLLLVRVFTEEEEDTFPGSLNFESRKIANKPLSDRLRNFSSLEEFEKDYQTANIEEYTRDVLEKFLNSAKELVETKTFNKIGCEHLYSYIDKGISQSILDNIDGISPEYHVSYHDIAKSKNLSSFACIMDMVTLAETAKILDERKRADIFLTAGNSHFHVLVETFGLNRTNKYDTLLEYIDNYQETIFITPYKLFAVFYRKNFDEFLDDYPSLKNLGDRKVVRRKYTEVFANAYIANKHIFSKIEFIDETTSYILRCWGSGANLEEEYFFQLFRAKTILYARLAYDLFAPLLYHDQLLVENGNIIIKSSDGAKIIVATKKTEEEKQKAVTINNEIEQKKVEFQPQCRAMFEKLDEINDMYLFNEDENKLLADYGKLVPEIKTLLGSEFKEGDSLGIFALNMAALKKIAVAPTTKLGGAASPQMQLVESYIRDYNFSFKDVKHYPTGVNIDAMRAKLKDQLANINEITRESDALSQSHELGVLYQTYVMYMAEKDKKKMIANARNNRPEFIKTTSHGMPIGSVAGGNLNIKYIIMIIVALIIIGLVVIIATMTDEKNNKPPRQDDYSFLDAFVP